MIPKNEPLHEEKFQPFGFTLHIFSNHAAIIAAAEQSFGRFGKTPASSTPADFRLRLLAHAVDDGLASAPVYRAAEGLVYQTTGRDSTVVVDTARGVGYGYFSPTTIRQTAFFRWHFLEFALFSMLPARGLLGVHGAAVVKNGQAILLRAASGGGKTTLAYAAARRDFQALAEDVVWLDTRSEGAWWGMPWSFHLLPDARQLFPELAGYGPQLQINGELKLEVDLAQIRPDSTTTRAHPGPIVLLKRVPGESSRLQQIDRKTALRLWLAGQAGNETTFPNYERLVMRYLKRGAYRLYFGDDIDAAIDLLDRLLTDKQ